MNSQVVVTAFAARRGEDTLVLSRKRGFPGVCSAACPLSGGVVPRDHPARERLTVGPRIPVTCPAEPAGSQGYMCAGFWPFLGLAGATGFVAPAGPVIAVTAC